MCGLESNAIIRYYVEQVRRPMCGLESVCTVAVFRLYVRRPMCGLEMGLNYAPLTQ